MRTTRLLLSILPLCWAFLRVAGGSDAETDSSSAEEWWDSADDHNLAADDCPWAYDAEDGLIYAVGLCMQRLDPADDYAKYSVQYVCKSVGNETVAFRQKYTDDDCDKFKSENMTDDWMCSGAGDETDENCYTYFRAWPSKEEDKCKNAGSYEEYYLVTGVCAEGTSITCDTHDKSVTVTDYTDQMCANETTQITTYEKGCNKDETEDGMALKIKVKRCGDKKFKSSNNGSSFPVGAIIGIAVGGAVVLAVIGFLIFKYVQAKQTDDGFTRL